MKIIKRDGREEEVSFDKVIKRLKFLCSGTTASGDRFGRQLDLDIIPLAQKVIGEIKPGITTRKIDEFAASTCAGVMMEHPDYRELAGRIIISNHHKNAVTSTFVDTIKLLYQNTDDDGRPNPLIAATTYKAVINNPDFFEQHINYLRDYRISYFGFKTLEKSYLLRSKVGHMVLQERPAHLWMRVAVGIHGEELYKVKETYELLSLGKLMHATPTLFNAGTPTPQLSSCFLSGSEDSMEGIYETIRNCALISKWSGGIGVHISNVRANGSLIRGTNGKSKGIVPMLKVYNDTARYSDQGGGKRKGSFAMYLEPWHADLLAFLDLKKTHGNQEMRALDLHYALFINDVFMERLQQAVTHEDRAVMWSFMCPDQCPGLHDAYGQEFTELYQRYEREGKYKKQMSILDIWWRIIASQQETGEPYMVYKDNVNRKSNQINIGVIKSSNLCVSPDTLILTREGYYPIKQLADTSVDIWNGTTWSRSLVKKTGINQSLLQVNLSNGAQIKCTPYHKFYLVDNSEISADQLRPEQTLLTADFPVIRQGQTHFASQQQVPINGSLDTKLAWLGHFIDLWGLLVNTELQIHLAHQSDDPQTLDEIRLMLTTMGLDVTHNRQKSELVLSASDLRQLLILGLQSRILANIQISGTVARRSIVSVLSVEPLPDTSDTYCFNESRRHMGVFNGVLAGNCAEIMEYSNQKEELIAVCNLASIPVNAFVDPDNQSYDFEALGHSVAVAAENLNKIIDINYYPVPSTKKSNLRERPMGIGIQGLADTFALMRYPFDSPEAAQLNQDIAETMYYYAVKTSVELAEQLGPYETFLGSPASQGLFQFDLWNQERELRDQSPVELSGRYDWESLRTRMKTTGLRNSLLLALMPTASTAQILGNNESIEPYTYNVYLRRVLSGEFKIINPHLQQDLVDRKLWSQELGQLLIAHRGSIQQIADIPQDLKDLYKTSFELKLKPMLDLALGRQPFIDQAQSLNWWVRNPDHNTLTSAHLYAWSHGLKTGMYYLRREAVSDAQQFTVAPSAGLTQVDRTTNPKQESNEETQSISYSTGATGLAPPSIPQSTSSVPMLCRKDDPDCMACQG